MAEPGSLEAFSFTNVVNARNAPYLALMAGLVAAAGVMAYENIMHAIAEHSVHGHSPTEDMRDGKYGAKPATAPDEAHPAGTKCAVDGCENTQKYPGGPCEGCEGKGDEVVHPKG